MITPLKAGEWFAKSAFLMNDPTQDHYTNDVVLPYAKIALDDLRLAYQENDISFCIKESDAILITAGVNNIGGNSGPALPNDLIEIFNIWERTEGDTYDYQLMTHRRFLPKNAVPTAFHEVYAWQGQVIRFPIATGNTEIKIDYLANNIADLANAETLVKISNVIQYLQYRTAGHLAKYVGENPTRANDLYNEAMSALEMSENIKIKSEQNIATRRLPFRARHKQNGKG